MSSTLTILHTPLLLVTILLYDRHEHYLCDGSTKYQLAALDSIEKPAKRLIGDPALINTKLQTLEHRRRVGGLLVSLLQNTF